MAKKSGNFFALITGVVAGAAAVFLSKPENRIQAEKTAKKIGSKAKQLKAEYKKNPEAFEKKIKTQAKKVIKKAIEKKVVKKASSPKKVPSKIVKKKIASKKK